MFGVVDWQSVWSLITVSAQTTHTIAQSHLSSVVLHLTCSALAHLSSVVQVQAEV